MNSKNKGINCGFLLSRPQSTPFYTFSFINGWLTFNQGAPLKWKCNGFALLHRVRPAATSGYASAGAHRIWCHLKEPVNFDNMNKKLNIEQICVHSPYASTLWFECQTSEEYFIYLVMPMNTWEIKIKKIRILEQYIIGPVYYCYELCMNYF